MCGKKLGYQHRSVKNVVNSLEVTILNFDKTFKKLVQIV